MNDSTFGPYFDPQLVGPDGKLSRFHKGGGAPSIPPPPAPPPRQATRAVQTVSRSKEQQAPRFGRGETVLTGQNSALSTAEQLARKTALSARV